MNAQDITLTADYHDRQCVVRRFDGVSRKEQLQTVATEPSALRAVMQATRSEAAARGGQAIWIQESTTGWARMQRLAQQCGLQFLLANVLQMPLPPKAKRRKTDKIDTARLQREYQIGTLPLAHQPSSPWRQVRRLVSMRENLTNRRTALSNWINRYLAHETWSSIPSLQSLRGQCRIRSLQLPAIDRRVIDWKLDELKHLEQQLEDVEGSLFEVYARSPEAQRLDAIRGLGPIGAVSVVARIGPIDRFQNAEQLIAFAGLAPGIHQSDATRHAGRIGGGGTDKHLRYYLIQATIWAREIPRYRTTYERVQRRRGKKIGRLVVARLLLRSIYKVLRDGVEFQPTPNNP
jgi:transposase